MLVRRRWPVATLLVTVAVLIGYYALSFPPIGLAVPVAAALYSAAEQGRQRWAIGTAGALLVMSTLVRVAEGDDPGYVLGYEFAASAGLMGAVIALGDGVRARRGWRAELDRRARESGRVCARCPTAPTTSRWSATRTAATRPSSWSPASCRTSC